MIAVTQPIVRPLPKAGQKLTNKCCRRSLVVSASQRSKAKNNHFISQFIATLGNGVQSVVNKVLQSQSREEEHLELRSWSDWLKVIRENDVNANEFYQLQERLDSFLSQSLYEEAHTTQQFIDQMCHKDFVFNILKEYGIAVQLERYSEAQRLRDQGQMYLTGWWIGYGEDDDVGHLMYVSYEYGRLLMNVFNTCALEQVLDYQSISPESYEQLREKLRDGVGSPAVEVYVRPDEHGNLCSQAAILVCGSTTGAPTLVQLPDRRPAHPSSRRSTNYDASAPVDNVAPDAAAEPVLDTENISQASIDAVAGSFDELDQYVPQSPQDNDSQSFPSLTPRRPIPYHPPPNPVPNDINLKPYVPQADEDTEILNTKAALSAPSVFASYHAAQYDSVYNNVSSAAQAAKKARDLRNDVDRSMLLALLLSMARGMESSISVLMKQVLTAPQDRKLLQLSPSERRAARAVLSHLGTRMSSKLVEELHQAWQIVQSAGSIETRASSLASEVAEALWVQELMPVPRSKSQDSAARAARHKECVSHILHDLDQEIDEIEGNVIGPESDGRAIQELLTRGISDDDEDDAVLRQRAIARSASGWTPLDVEQYGIGDSGDGVGVVDGVRGSEVDVVGTGQAFGIERVPADINKVNKDMFRLRSQLIGDGEANNSSVDSFQSIDPPDIYTGNADQYTDPYTPSLKMFTQGTLTYRRIDTSLNTRADPFSGIYIGNFGPHGTEMVQVTYGLDEDGSPSIVAEKLTGDENVPACAVTFRAKVGPQNQKPLTGAREFPEYVQRAIQERYVGQGRVANAGYKSSRWVPGELLLFSKTHQTKELAGVELGFLWQQPGVKKFLVLFNRVSLDRLSIL